MDSDLQQARRLEKEFFLRWPTQGFAPARQLYADEHNKKIAQVITISNALQELTKRPEVSLSLRQSGEALTTYGPLVTLYANSFNGSVELAAELSEPEAGR